MIKGLFETHLYVENLESSINFYSDIMGLQQCHFEPDRRVAFFWIGKPQKDMLGLWEKPITEIEKRHFAFTCDADFILNKAIDFLKNKNLAPYNFLKDGTEQPMVFAWMPAISIYFNDPDGHYLEFIAILEGTPKPALGVITYQQWLEKK
jgi:lactoylglutathione lyase